MVEEMVETYYNSGQFAMTMGQLEKEFVSPYEMYLQLGAFYEKEGLNLLNHSRIARYEILLRFISTLHTGKEGLYRELLTFDLYQREHVKSRPTFAGEYTVPKEVKRQFDKNVHLEKFQYDILGDCKEEETLILFDYEKRSYCKISPNSLQ
jgi:hypothetical protein